MDVVAWLEGLDLGQYASVFGENGVDGAVLCELTADDLKEIGVDAVGHRRKLLAGIAALRADAASAFAEPIPEVHPATKSREAERRQLTVMFVDLVASTALATVLDPEDLREVISAYHHRVAEVVCRYDGHVAKFMGDGVLAYFGYPRAHEDDAERAVRAGLELFATAGRGASREDPSLQVRVGIATGLVVAGDLIGEGAARDEVVGETPNLAARLQALAEPGTLVMSRETRRLVRGLFELADLGEQELKGFAEPVQAWRVLGASATEGRFEARHAAGVTPLVGREHELDLLLDRWQQAKEGEGQIVLLSGEPGIGKSRLVRALRERLGDEPCATLSHFCSPFHQTSALHPVIDLLERAAGFARDDPPARKLDRLEALLARGTNDVTAAAPLIAALLSIPTGDRYPALDLAPQRQKHETLNALLAQLTGLAAERPVLALYEDVHWADPSTLELLERVIERVQRLPVLVLVTFRPEFAPPWHGQAHLTAFSLNRLNRRRGAAMVVELTGGKALPAEVLEQILLKTDGVPLFVEELTKAVLESGLLQEEGDRYVLGRPLPSLAIPPTLQDSLMARLDRLAPVKEVAQVAACIGREFSYQLLAAVLPLDAAALQDALHGLAQAELVFGQGTPPEASYAFKHALVRDAAYESLLKSKRQQLHGRIAGALEEGFRGIAETQPELVAHHCTEAGLSEKAVEYWLKAGQSALKRSAMAEAVVQLRKGLEMLAGLPDGAARCRQELDFQVALGVALISSQGWGAPEVGQAYARARELSEQIGETAQLWPVLYGQWAFQFVRAEHDAAREVAEELLYRAQEHRDADATMVGHRIVGTGAFWRSEVVAAHGHLERALALYNPERHRSFALLCVQDPRVTALSTLSLALAVLGYPEQARARSREALGAARELAHGTTLAYARMHACFLAQFCRADRDARDQAKALAALAIELKFPHFVAAAMAIRGWALAEAGEVEAGLAQLREGLAAWRVTGARIHEPYFLGLQAEAHGRVGQVLEALALLKEALERVKITGEGWSEAELHRLRGEALLRTERPNLQEAEARFQQALSLARKQSAKWWELRAARSLARLWAGRSERRKAYDLLAPAYDWFTEGFDTPDLIEAKALLDQLRSSGASAHPI